MTVTLPTETEELVAEQVRSGRFATPEAVLVAAVAAFSQAPTESKVDDDEADWDTALDAEDIAAIAEADAEAERGEVFSFEEARAMILGPLGRQP